MGSFFDTHHGLTNAVITPYVIVHNREAIAERMKVVARVLDLPKPGVEGVLAWVLDFRKELGIPHTLADIGVTLRNPEEIGREAAIDPSAGGNPIPVDAATLERIFRSAVKGDLSLKSWMRPMTASSSSTAIEAATRAKHVSVGGTDSGNGYAATLKRLNKDIETDIVRPADEVAKLPEGVALGDYNGAVITGSALNIYSLEPAVERQVELAKAVFAAGVPCFGSCWGLQVGVTAAGGKRGAQSARPRVRFRRGASRSRSAGRDHAMFQGKPEVFEACTVHVEPWRACRPARRRSRTTTWGCRPPRSASRTAPRSGACSITPSTAAPRSRRWRGATRTC